MHSHQGSQQIFSTSAPPPNPFSQSDPIFVKEHLLQHDIHMPSSSSSQRSPFQTSIPLLENLFQPPTPGGAPWDHVSQSGQGIRQTASLHFSPSLLDLVHQTHPNTVADCLLWPPPLLCHYLQWITQIFSSNLSPQSCCYHSCQLNGNQNSLPQEANMPAKQIDSLQIFIPLPFFISNFPVLSGPLQEVTWHGLSSLSNTISKGLSRFSWSILLSSLQRTFKIPHPHYRVSANNDFFLGNPSDQSQQDPRRITY